MAAWPSDSAAARRSRQSAAVWTSPEASDWGASRAAVLDAQRITPTPMAAPIPSPTRPQKTRLIASSPPPAAAPAARGLVVGAGRADRLAQPVGERAQLDQGAGDGGRDGVDHAAHRAGDALGGGQDAVDPDKLLVAHGHGGVDLAEQRHRLSGDAVDQVLGRGQDPEQVGHNDTQHDDQRADQEGDDRPGDGQQAHGFCSSLSVVVRWVRNSPSVAVRPGSGPPVSGGGRWSRRESTATAGREGSRRPAQAWRPAGTGSTTKSRWRIRSRARAAPALATPALNRRIRSRASAKAAGSPSIRAGSRIPRMAMPRAMPTWRKVLLTPEAMPLRVAGTTPRAA